MLLDEVDFDDFDLSKYDRKTILLNNNNPEKGTQTNTFNETESESTRTRSPWGFTPGSQTKVPITGFGRMDGPEALRHR